MSNSVSTSHEDSFNRYVNPNLPKMVSSEQTCDFYYKTVRKITFSVFCIFFFLVFFFSVLYLRESGLEGGQHKRKN